MYIKPLRKLTKNKRGTIKSTYKKLIGILGEPNVTDLDDPTQVSASWGFIDDQEREAFVWGHHPNEDVELFWNCGGDPFVLQKLFPHTFHGSLSGWG